jgi:hypothetical protein
MRVGGGERGLRLTARRLPDGLGGPGSTSEHENRGGAINAITPVALAATLDAISVIPVAIAIPGPAPARRCSEILASVSQVGEAAVRPCRERHGAGARRAVGCDDVRRLIRADPGSVD